ncbi:hypothetical protein ACH47Z_09510 [Streptomyces sp. NPDC020192]|uniref:hypothetical protein n=1 Tax=Streptomyces sp. NPDC020192 TaxID=3365066 RepID=UPI0037B83670
MGRPVSHTDVPLQEWIDNDLRSVGLPDHVFQHISAMARLHAENRYDRKVTGRSASGVADFVRKNEDLFTR